MATGEQAQGKQRVTTGTIVGLVVLFIGAAIFFVASRLGLNPTYQVVFGGLAVVCLLGLLFLALRAFFPAVWAVAMGTFFEARRKRFTNVILVFAVILIGLSSFFASLSPSAELNMFLDVGLGAIRLCGMLIAVFMGARLVADEVDRRTVDVILAKPVRRSTFIIGKFIGAWVTILAFLLVMGVAFMIVYQIKAPALVQKAQAVGLPLSIEETSINVFKATILVLFEMMVLSSIAITISTVSSWIFSAVSSLAIYFAGQLASYFHHMATFNDPSVQIGVNPVAKTFAWVIYRVIPHFEHFDIREKILTHDPVYWDMIGMTAGHAVLYSFVMLALACVFFSYREF